MSLFSARTLKFLWASDVRCVSHPVMCGSWNLQSPNLYERSTSTFRRTRRTRPIYCKLASSVTSRILAKSYLTMSVSSVPVEVTFNLWVDPQSEEECTGGIPRQHYLRLFTTIILSTSQSTALFTAWGLNDFAVINDTHMGLIYKTS